MKEKNSFFTSLPFKLLVGVILGIVSGIILNTTDGSGITSGILNVVVTLKYVLGQLINFCVPLIIIGFIAPSITKLGNSASHCDRLRLFHWRGLYVYSSRICNDSSFIHCH